MTENYIDHFFYHVLPNLKIAVIGDIMVDRYVFGKVERISPGPTSTAQALSCEKAMRRRPRCAFLALGSRWFVSISKK